jgi:hypothetical protein
MELKDIVISITLDDEITNVYSLAELIYEESILERFEEEHGCDGSCMNESINHCECGPMFEDSEITNVKIEQIESLRKQVEEKDGEIDRLNLPWRKTELYEWSICGMNHYHVDGQRYLFVSLCKDGRCIKAEGFDDDEIWNILIEQAKAEGRE